MQEELITFETAKLAKEKGFNEKVYREYDKSGYLRCTSKSADVVLGPYEELLKSTEYPAPTQSLLQRWLREVHKINIVIQYWTGLKPHKPVLHYRTTVNENFFGEHYVTYEEALEEALFESLKLIEL